MSHPHLIRLGWDIVLWVLCIIVIGFLSGADLIENPAFSLAGAALFWAIRANTKAEVNTAHKNSEEA
jgi:Na+/H+ antiporter NhaD/arsenite permease-like protein